MARSDSMTCKPITDSTTINECYSVLSLKCPYKTSANILRKPLLYSFVPWDSLWDSITLIEDKGCSETLKAAD